MIALFQGKFNRKVKSEMTGIYGQTPSSIKPFAFKAGN
jgi:hypothetical protein